MPDGDERVEQAVAGRSATEAAADGSEVRPAERAYGDAYGRSSLGHVPEGKWTFDDDVTEVFSDMLERSIPGYAEMRRLVFEIGARFVQRGTSVVDLGTARGEALAPFVNRFGAYNRFVGVEASEPMLEAARARFRGYVEKDVNGVLPGPIVDLRRVDLRYEYPPERASLTLAVLTAQFVPIEYRYRLFDRIFASTVDGGALVLVEKVLGETPTTDALFRELHHEEKAAAGYSSDEIDRKALALEGVLVPVSVEMNVGAFLHGAGFSIVECFWRHLNFAGFLAIRRRP